MKRAEVLGFFGGTMCSVAALAASPALAQAQPKETSETAAQASAGGEYGDIIVTATKREQSLSRVGLSVSAVGAEALANQRIGNIGDLAHAVPGLTFTPSPNATPVYTLRGVGFFESSLAAYPSVAVYLDQVPLSLPIMSSLTAFDLERVEVLKGPQGTLFGNNATGGAINFVAAKPTDEFHAGGEISYGRFNTLETQGFISGPITDTLRARIAVKAANGDEWQYSYTRDDKTGRTDNIAARLLLDWDASDRLKFSLDVNGWRDQNDPQSPQKIANTPQFPRPATFPILAFPVAPNNARATDFSTRFPPKADNRFWQATLRGDYDFGSVKLTSLTGYSRVKFLNTTEGDGTPLTDLDIGEDLGRIRSFTQELRLANDAASRLRWVIGGNFERTTVYEQTGIYYHDTTTSPLLGIAISGYWDDQVMKNYAGFANAEFDVSDQLTLKGGIRQNKAKRRWTAFNGDLPDYPLTNEDFVQGVPPISLTTLFNGLYSAIYGPGVVPTIQPFGSIVLDTRTNRDGSPVDPSTYLTAGLVRGHLNEDSTSWNAGVDFKPSSDLLIYGNVAQGYKSGSFAHLTGATTGSYVPAVQEELLSYEVGFKAQLLDRRLSVTGAAFYYDFKNKQLLGTFVDPVFNTQNRLINVPKSRVKGAEIELRGQPMQGLTFSAAATYLDAEITKYDGVVGSFVDPATGFNMPITTSFKGAKLPFSPKWSYALRSDYKFPLSSALNGFLGVGVNGQTKTIGLPAIGPTQKELYKIRGYSLVDGQIGVEQADGRWRLTIWGKNLFNKYYWTNAIQAFDVAIRYAGRPAEYGVTLGFKM